MRLSDIKIGESYYYWGQEWVAEIIEKADKSAGIWQSGVLCRSQETGELRKVTARMLTSWADHLAAERVYSDEIAEIAKQVKRLTDAAGPGAVYPVPVDSHYVPIMFTEEAAERVLELCGAKPIPDDKRPSKADDDDVFIERCSRLSQRVRRAIGVGYAGQNMGYSLAREDDIYHAKLYLYADEVKQAADKLLGVKAEEEQSALAGLLS